MNSELWQKFSKKLEFLLKNYTFLNRVSKKANVTLIGVFIVIAMLLFLVAIFAFSSASWFAKKITFYTFFNTSLNGLEVGAPVKFKGIKVGTVKFIEIIYDVGTDKAVAAVIFDVDANLFKTVGGSRMRVTDHNMFYTEQIGRGLAAKLSMESILTGKLFVGLDYHKNGRERFSKDIILGKYQQMPSVATELDELMTSFDVIMGKLSKVEWEKSFHMIISTLDNLKNAAKTLDFASIKRAMDAISSTLSSDSSTRQSVDDILQQLAKMLRALRVLLEYIERNPNALIVGKAL
ncbi:MAG: MlaD family protein [Puniceicoccales bacterium]|jgi:paraquat-inducible protein B|nr:MlaD family protein [Puniceicoccales bacterium]